MAVAGITIRYPIPRSRSVPARCAKGETTVSIWLASDMFPYSSSTHRAQTGARARGCRCDKSRFSDSNRKKSAILPLHVTPANLQAGRKKDGGVHPPSPPSPPPLAGSRCEAKDGLPVPSTAKLSSHDEAVEAWGLGLRRLTLGLAHWHKRLTSAQGCRHRLGQKTGYVAPPQYGSATNTEGRLRHPRRNAGAGKRTS